jgi:outer membrane protein OmpA-like peptidoglycan-associated protein
MKRDYRTTCWVMLAVSIIAFTGCQTANEHRTATGGIAGAALGGGAGALIDKSNPYRGALIGAAVGSLVGGGIGHVLQKQKQAFDRIEGLETREQTVILQQPPPPVEAGQPVPPRQSEQKQALLVNVPSEVFFDKGSSSLSAQGAQKARQIAEVLKEYPDSDIYIRGYTSSEGTDADNFELSQRRAQVVKNELATAGVAGSRLYAQGMGSSNPIASNDTEAGRVQNRRVEIHVVPTVAPASV